MGRIDCFSGNDIPQKTIGTQQLFLAASLRPKKAVEFEQYLKSGLEKAFANKRLW
jgi:hypothetical protein